jgi:hypothetical protein
MKKSIITSILLMGMLLFGSSCVNDDEFIQEGVLKITFSDTISIKNDTKVVVDVMDIADREHVIFTKESVGNRPVEITLNTGNYLVRVMTDNHTTLRAFQIQKDKVYEISI